MGTHGGLAALTVTMLCAAALLAAAARADAGAAGTAAAPPAIDPDRLPPLALAVADPVHDELEALAARNLLALPDLFVRPLGRYRLARALAALELPEGDADGIRARRALAPELADLGTGDVATSRPLFQADGEDARLRIESFARFQAEGFPERGFVLTDSTRAGLRADLTLWPGAIFMAELYVADVPGGRQFADPLIPDSDVIIYLDRGYLAFHTRYADVTFGRDRQGWAPGRSGTLLLSETARPFTHLRLQRAFLDDRLHAIIENGVLSGTENRYVAFHRLDWRITPRLRLGLAEGARYDAQHIEPLYLVGIIPYTLVGRLLERDNQERASDERVRNNVMWDLDATWRPLDGLELYGELLIDDIGTETSQTPTRIGYQLGAFHVGRLVGHELRLRGEWTRVWRWVYSVFYGADFVHQDVPLGYPLGPDSRHLMLEGEVLLDDRWTAGLRVVRQDRGENRIGDYWDPDDPSTQGADASQFQGIVERQWQLIGTAGFQPCRHLDVELELGYANIKNAAHVEGARANGAIGKAVLAIRY
jgi:hypothetical protein